MSDLFRRIGGSDIGKLLGLSNYGNESDVYLRIREGLEDVWSPLMERGAAVEPQLRAYGQSVLGIELEDSASDYHDHPTLEFARAQIDDIAKWKGLGVCVDYKSQNRWARGWGAPNTDEIPASIHAQVAWEMLCADREMALVVVGFGEDRPSPEIFHIANVATYEVQREPTFESVLIQTARDFWNRHIIPGVPPSIKPLGKKQAKKS